MRKLITLISFLALASMILSACGGAAPATEAPPPVATEAPSQATAAPTEAPATEAPTAAPAPEGAKVLHLNTSGTGDIPTIDPALTTDTTSVQVVEETTVGLTPRMRKPALPNPAWLPLGMWSTMMTGLRPLPSTCAIMFRG